MVKNLLNKKESNKGFTLVELIVVLVILAILAAILVPALLGYIDRAREKQYVLNAKSWLTATQAEFSSLYGEGKNPADISTRSTTIANTADVPECDVFEVYCGVEKLPSGYQDGDSKAVPDNHGAYTVKAAYYEQDGHATFFNGTSWETVEKGQIGTLPNGTSATPVKIKGERSGN
jgi:prepilin-type N-terminal cleavage/methylation domain-containing protein